MFRTAWQIIKALLGRQDGRVPADPRLHRESFGVVGSPPPGPLQDGPSTDFAPAKQPAPAVEAVTPSAAMDVAVVATTAQPRKVLRPLHALRIASVAKLNRPAAAKAATKSKGRSGARPGSKRKTGSNCKTGSIGKCNSKGKRTRLHKLHSPQAQAWIIAARRKRSAPRTAAIVAFPAHRRSRAAVRKAA